MDVSALERLDSFPYRHTVADVMSRPPITARPDLSMEAASRIMHDLNISSVVLIDEAGRPTAILTERDMIDAIVAEGAAALGQPADRFAGRPLQTIEADCHVYVALARMERLGVQHLAVVNVTGALVGVLTARALLRMRAGRALALGDQIEIAESAADMAKVQAGLPALAKALLAEAVDARGVAAVISAVCRDISGRAATLAERDMAAAGLGPPPAPYAFLVLGSGGRGESLLAADQDNALVHAGAEADDPWYAELGRRAADILDGSGIPYCKGAVMAANSRWRASLDGWRGRIRRWVERPEGESLLNVEHLL